jgi:hypothetical protein
MQRTTGLLLFILLLTGHLSAQNPNRVSIKGQVVDTTGEQIALPTVMLLNPKDSTLINFTRGDDKGNFAFKNVKNTGYLLKVSYVGYLPLQQYLPPSATETNDVGLLKIKPITAELLEVVVRAAKATLSIRGDTVEYDASSFKVPPGSTVEDLLRRLPGIDVDADGNIKAQGRDVKRVYVDGKTFFGDDPKAATKNLGAETISKVQVYNEKSEQAQLTGVDDGKKEKAMNLELKEEYKKGAFGKVTAAVGTDERLAARGNYNRFNSKEQFSVIGYGNNINQTGVNWEDYGEFKGQNTFNDNDNADFGFSNGSRYFFFGGDGDIPFNDFDGRGFTENYGAGANYNYDNKKTKLNASYFYNQTDLDLDQFSFRQTFLPDGTLFNTDSTIRSNFRSNHNISSRFQHDIDSNNVLIIKANSRFSASDALSQQAQLFGSDNVAQINNLFAQNANALDAWRMSSTAIFRHRFKKKGRSLAWSGGFNGSDSDGTEEIFSNNQLFQESLTVRIRQQNANENRNRQYKSSVLFTEPLAKKLFGEAFYNFSHATNRVNRQVNDPESNGRRIDSLSNFFDNTLRYQRLGSSLRYSNSGLNLSVGLALQELRLVSEYATDEGLPLLAAPIQRSFLNWTPNVDLNYEFPNNFWVGGSYTFGVTAPEVADLQPVPNVNNPAFRVEGNPNLSPARSHDFNLNISHWNPASFSNIGIGANMSLFEDQIIRNQFIELVDSIGLRTTTRPDNVSGGRNLNTYLWSNFPIVKTKLSMGINGNLSWQQSPAFVNGIENQTNNTGYGLSMNLSITPSPSFIMGIGGGFNLQDLRFSIDAAQNQHIENYNLETSVKWQVISKTFLESNLDYNVFSNDRFGFRQEVPIWNASLRRLVGKTNRMELRLAAFDLLNRRLSVTQNGAQNFVARTTANTLARYFMLSASYNMRGYENKIKKNEWW